MSLGTQAPATLDDLYGVKGKAELIGGVVHFMASGVLPSRVAFKIAMRLDHYARQTGVGEAYPDGIGYAQRPPLLSGRQSFSPDASYSSVLSLRMRCASSTAPTFAVKVRSEQDYGDAAEAEQAAKRADYFEAGTLVVWDVDPLAKTITVYRADAPTQPVVFGPGQVADADRAGWRLAVADIFS